MGCSYDDGCYRISKNYDNYSRKIEKDLSDGVNDINEIMCILGEYEIPDDYLGNKVKEKIKQINKVLTDDTNEMNNVMIDIKSFATEKSDMHMKHYNNWKERQRATEKEKQEVKLED